MTDSDSGQVLLLTNADVEGLLSTREVMRALDEAYTELARGKTANRPRTFTFSLNDTQGTFLANTHEGIIRTKSVYDIRIVTHIRAASPIDNAETTINVRQNNCSLNLLYDTNSGDLLAVLHDGYLQKLRVQATNAIAARYLARTDAQRMSILGSGWQASAAIEFMSFVRPIKEVRVFSRNEEKRKEFVRGISEARKDVEVRACDNAQDAVRGADMVVAATNSNVPVFKGEWIEKGMHLTGVRSVEFDLESYRRADVIVIFNRLHGRNYGLRRGPEEEGLEVDPHAEFLKGAAEISDLYSGQAPGRTSDGQVTIFANGGYGWGYDGGPGYGIQFTAMAKLAYDLARRRGIGRSLPLEWFQQTVNS